jgi:hypothetical protein
VEEEVGRREVARCAEVDVAQCELVVGHRIIDCR